MRILILGGTVFVGCHLVEAARRRGHQVTLFNRGLSDVGALIPDVERLTGDRTTDLTALEGRRWDVVIDTCGYTPASVRRSAEALAESVGLYAFISSVSVYREQVVFMPLPDDSAVGVDEHGPLKSMTAEEVEAAEQMAAEGGVNARSLGAMYGPLKALCEQAAEKAMPGRVLHVRPALIVGPHDYSDRFTWWVRRVARGGEILAPGRPGRQVRCIDARDLAEWSVRMIEAGATGVYNATGAPRGWTMERLLEVCKTVSGSDASFTWVSEQFLEEQEVRPWIELPLWLPEAYNGFYAARNDKAIAAGLTFRDLNETVRDTLAWDQATAFESTWNTGLDRKVEQRLLKRFAARSA